MNFIGTSLKNSRYEQFVIHLETIFWAQIQLICNLEANTTKKLDIYCVQLLFYRYAWVVPLKDKRGISIVNAFQNILDSSNRKPNKIWVDQGREFYKKLFKGFLKINNTEMYSTYN